MITINLFIAHVRCNRNKHRAVMDAIEFSVLVFEKARGEYNDCGKKGLLLRMLAIPELPSLMLWRLAILCHGTLQSNRFD